MGDDYELMLCALAEWYCEQEEKEHRHYPGGGGGIIGAYITEDASQFYITEDGSQVYVIESAF